MFLDEVTIQVRAGHGGPGAVSFLREKFRPKGGPDGGNGGRGGSVWVVATTSTNTLVDYRFVTEFKAQDGQRGGATHCSGRDGEDLELQVPPGTIVTDADTGEQLADLDGPGKRVCAVQGGKGGRGNASFATSTNQAPRHAQPGLPGEERTLRLELKLLADVGLIGMPNVGKSTLISRVSNARPKIADYPFTTLIPNLGVVERGVLKSFVVADVPGLIPGASEGKGLGIQFLKHVERTRVLVHLLDPVAGRDPAEDWAAIREELGRFNPALLERPEIVVLTKADTLPDPDATAAEVEAALGRKPGTIPAISAVSGRGVDALVKTLAELVEESRRGAG